MQPNKILLALFLALLIGPSALAEPPNGVVEMFDFDGNYGTLTRASVGVPRAKPSPALDAVARWRASAEAFTHGFAMSRGANGTESFQTRRVYEDEIGQAHVRLSQTIAGLPVVGAELIVHADSQTGKVRGVNGSFAIDRGLARSPRIAAGDAIAATMREYGIQTARIESAPELTYIVDEGGSTRLAWTNLVSYVSENGLELDRLYADALSGAAIARHPQVRRAKNREMYDCLNQSALWTNCTFLFGEGGSSSDAAAMAAYNNAGIAHDYFLEKHGRDGMDGNGIVLRQGVHYGYLYNRAGWYPPGTYNAIVYGDGNGIESASTAFSLDIVAHEFTHGVIAHETSLVANVEQRSIDEGLADVFAMAVDADHEGTPDWWIAEDVHTPNVSNDALRYLDDPADQPGQKDYYPERSSNDNDGAHKNAGIVGLAFYMMVEGGGPPNARGWVHYIDPDFALSMAKSEKIFYHAIAAYMTNNMNFRKLRLYTEQAASDFYHSVWVDTVRAAWDNVGNAWQTHTQQLPANSQWVSSSYTANGTGYHTAQYQGSGSFKLYLEKSTATGWVVQASSTGTSAVKLIEMNAISSGVFRWRVVSATASGSFTLHTNHPY